MKGKGFSTFVFIVNCILLIAMLALTLYTAYNTGRMKALADVLESTVEIKILEKEKSNNE